MLEANVIRGSGSGLHWLIVSVLAAIPLRSWKKKKTLQWNELEGWHSEVTCEMFELMMNENDDGCNKKSDGFDCNDSAQYDPGPKSLAWVIYWISCYIPAIYPRLRWYTLPLIMKIYHLALLRKPTNKEGYSKMNLWNIQSCREKVFYQLDQIGQLLFVWFLFHGLAYLVLFYHFTEWPKRRAKLGLILIKHFHLWYYPQNDQVHHGKVESSKLLSGSIRWYFNPVQQIWAACVQVRAPTILWACERRWGEMQSITRQYPSQIDQLKSKEQWHNRSNSQWWWWWCWSSCSLNYNICIHIQAK